jgi:hypothetical protein
MGRLGRLCSQHYDVEVVGITVSREQAKLARQRCEGTSGDHQTGGLPTMKVPSIASYRWGCSNMWGRPLSHLHAHDPPLPGTRGAFSAAHHRRQPIRAFLRPLDFQIHLPKFHAAIQPADFIGSRKTAGPGRLAQLRADTTIPRCWPGTKISRRTGTASSMLMTDVFSACGPTTCWPAPGHSAPAGISYGRSFFPLPLRYLSISPFTTRYLILPDKSAI